MKIITKYVIHRNQKRIQLIFDYDREIINLVRKVPDCRWSATMQCWHIANNKDSLQKLKNIFKKKDGITLSINNSTYGANITYTGTY